MPTRWPNLAKPAAKLTATMLLPTPPLPLATATKCLISKFSSWVVSRKMERGLVSKLIRTSVTPLIAATTLRARRSIGTCSGLPASRSITVKLTTPSRAAISLTILSDTKSRLTSGSSTVASAACTWSIVTWGGAFRLNRLRNCIAPL